MVNLYIKKTYSGTIPSGADSGNVNFFVDNDIIGNADTIFISEGYIIDTRYNNFNPLWLVDMGSNTIISMIFISTNQNSIRGRILSDYIGCPIVVTIKYTKITD